MKPTISCELDQQVMAAERRIDELNGVSRRLRETPELRRELIIAYETKLRALEMLRLVEPEFMPSGIAAEIDFLRTTLSRLKTNI